MNVQSMNVDQAAAREALKQYRAHRDTYDKRDWEIERIYRAISRGKTVISVRDAIIKAGFDELGRPRLAIARADDVECRCWVNTGKVVFSKDRQTSQGAFKLDWPGAVYRHESYGIRAACPRIPPQYRPAVSALPNYHLLWEAEWKDLPRDPYLLKRIGKDAWVVLAAWDLTDIEISVLRAHAPKQ